MSKFITIFFIFVQFATVFLLGVPQTKPVNAYVPLTQAYLTLGNSRLSYKALIDTTTSTGATAFSINTSGDANHTDKDTFNLFPGDSVCFNNSFGAVFDGCANQSTYAVTTTDNTNSDFRTATSVTGAITAGTSVVATQSGVLSITFTPQNSYVTGDQIILQIPSSTTSNRHNDGIPDDNGFDSADLPADLTAGTCAASVCFTPTSFTASAVALAAATTYHVVTITLSSALTGGNSYSFTLGHATNAALRFLNPAPCDTTTICENGTTTRTHGQSDKYGFILQLKNSSGPGVIIEQDTLRGNPNDGVLIDASVPESLTFIVTGRNAATTNCGQSASVTTTAYGVPFGSLSSVDTFYNAAQQLEVKTNASAGFFVTIEESDQMGRSGNVCTGTSPSAGEFTFTAGTCIRDTTCNASPCSETTSADWTAANTYYGLGYSLENVTNTPASFLYNESSRTFSAKQIADMQGAETKQNIMTKSTVTASDKAYVCYRVTIPATQPAGYYYNNVKYIATARF